MRVSLPAIAMFSVMIFSNHTLPHSESIVWTSPNRISALSESLAFSRFFQLTHRYPPEIRKWITRASYCITYSEYCFIFYSLMKISRWADTNVSGPSPKSLTVQ